MTDKRKSDRLLETGGGLDLLADISVLEDIDFVGTELGDYRITGSIGAGGMGKVYRAKRIDGSFEREVAIKIAPVGSFDEEMRRRFLREQRLLAELVHPNISQLYDAQVTEQQWPYIVMELVDGRPIDSYCEEAGLGLDDRVRLLIQVAEAVAYANARLIVHRDIKPANVLVDREGTPKLLDFGIARLITGDIEMHTRTLTMTPGYASPEQLLGRQANVASDVYQLGLLIFATLTGQALAGGDTLNDAIERAAAGRSLQIPASSRSDLPRELLLVIEQCLRPDPDDRYPDANALKDDLKAFLGGFPVRAAGMGPAYRFRKLLARNRPMAAVVALALVSIIGSTIWYTRAVGLERDEALRQTRMADASLDFLLDVFEAAAPENAQGREISATELLDQGAARAAGETIDEPAVRARVLLSLGSVYKSLEQLEKAETMVLQGLEVSEAEFGADSAMHLRLQGILGNIYREKGDLAAATPLLEHVLERTRALFGPDDERTLGARANLASSYLDEGRLDEALGMIREIYDQREARDPAAESTLRSAVALVNVLYRLGRHEEAIGVGTEALDRADAALGENHPISMSLLNNMASHLHEPAQQPGSLGLRRTGNRRGAALQRGRARAPPGGVRCRRLPDPAEAGLRGRDVWRARRTREERRAAARRHREDDRDPRTGQRPDPESPVQLRLDPDHDGPDRRGSRDPSRAGAASGEDARARESRDVLHPADLRQSADRERRPGCRGLCARAARAIRKHARGRAPLVRRTGGVAARLAAGKAGDGGVFRLSSGYSTLPGFISPFGSSAALMARMVSSASGSL